MKPIIEVNHLSKKYKYGESQPYYTLRDSLSNFAKKAFDIGKKQDTLENDEFWALKDVLFKVNQGEALGIIGPNGAGKSTLLKILSRITPPTFGEAILRGRVGSLLEVGTGFQQELTGRENIYLNGAILGMTRREINSKFDKIIEFAEVEKFIDTPVKHYSSGMYMRLAFAIAAYLEPDILIVDEVLAVGDAKFQEKCLKKMESIANNDGRTILFVSHNMAAIQNLCDRSILLQGGEISSIGKTEKIVNLYTKSMENNPSNGNFAFGSVNFSLKIRNGKNKTTTVVAVGEKIMLDIDFSVTDAIANAAIGIGIIDTLGRRVVTFHTKYQYTEKVSMIRGCHSIIEWPGNFLCPGRYQFVIALYNGQELVAHWDSVGSLTVIESDYFGTGKLPDPQYQGSVLAKVKWLILTH